MLPRVIIYNAVSLDGRIDWLTPDIIGLYYQLARQWEEDATLAGCDTLLSAPEEIPPEDAAPREVRQRQPGDTRPLLIVPDSRGRVRRWQYLLALPYWRDAVALCSRSTPQDYLDYLDEWHIDRIIAGDDYVDFRTALEEVNARYGVGVVRVDSGGTLNGILLRAGLVDEVSLLIHPSLVGGVSSRSFFRAPDLTSAESVIPLRLTHIERLDADLLWLRYEVTRSASTS